MNVCVILGQRSTKNESNNNTIYHIGIPMMFVMLIIGVVVGYKGFHWHHNKSCSNKLNQVDTGKGICFPSSIFSSKNLLGFDIFENIYYYKHEIILHNIQQQQNRHLQRLY